MKKSLSSCLVIIITFITVLAMASFKPRLNEEYFMETYTSGDEEDEALDRPNGTGYIFDDFDKGINIPLKNTTEEKKSPDEVKDKSSDNYEFDRLRKALKEQLEYMEYQKAAEADMSTGKIIKEFKIITSKKPSEMLQETISFNDKVFLLKAARHLSLKDIGRIRAALDKGASKEELQAIWDMLEEKVPEKDYDKLVQIVSKYDQ